MPIYDYECDEHGVFEEIRPFEESSTPINCPTCGKSASRVFSAPNTRILTDTTRKAMDRNLASRHEPHVCSSGCGHNHSKPKQQPGQKPKPISYTGPRPWVIEHA